MNGNIKKASPLATVSEWDENWMRSVGASRIRDSRLKQPPTLASSNK